MTIRFLIADAYSVGGTIRTTFNTAAELARRHDVEVVSVYRRRDEPELELDPRVRLRALADLRPARLARARRWAAARPSRVIHREDHRFPRFNAVTDVALVRFLRATRDGVLIGTRPGLNVAIARFASPVVVRVGQDHMNLGSYKPGLRAAIARTYPRLDAVTALTQGSADEYAALLPRTHVECIPNAAPHANGRRADLQARSVVAAGRLIRRKGFDRLLTAWARVAHEHPSWRLDVFGRGPEKDELAQLAGELGVGDSVHLRGYTARLTDMLAGGSVFALTSRREGFPMVLLEAMAVGLPVVAYDCPTGPRDIVTDGVDGYIVPDGHTQELAAALDELMDAEHKRRSFGAAALAKAARYESAAIAARWEELFAELAAEKRA
jgi:glycosyltransferase involved in cell wall biosynthesis